MVRWESWRYSASCLGLKRSGKRTDAGRSVYFSVFWPILSIVGITCHKLPMSWLRPLRSLRPRSGAVRLVRRLLTARPQLALSGTLGLARSTPVGVARGRDVFVTCWRGSPELLSRRQSTLSSFARMIDRLLKSAGFDGDFRQERVELGKPHGGNEARNEAFDEHESFANGEFEDPMHEIANCRVVQPLVERTVSRIDSSVWAQLFWMIHVLLSLHAVIESR